MDLEMPKTGHSQHTLVPKRTTDLEPVDGTPIFILIPGDNVICKRTDFTNFKNNGPVIDSERF